MKEILKIIMAFPLMLAIFPVPLLFPIVLTWMCIDQPEETPLVVIYFSWLIIGLITIYFIERNERTRKSRTPTNVL